MSSFFQEDDDSDQERAETQRRRLEIIRTEDAVLKTKSSVSPPTEEPQSEIEAVSEEKELEALRGNVKYQAYAAASRQRAELTSERELKRQRTNLARGENTDEEEDDKNIDPIPVTIRGDRDGEPTSSKLDELWTGPSPSTPVLSTEYKKSKPRLDPKIIDDSDDDTSGSESGNEAPLGPAPPPSAQPKLDNYSSVRNLPIHNEAILGTAHDSYVSCFALDNSGNRLVSGSLDSTAKFFDFHVMNRSLRSFRSIVPLFESPIRSIQYSSTGRMLLFSGGSKSAVITDREGTISSQTAKGDMYIVDSARTKGHTGQILAAKWKPSGSSPSSVVVTTSADATVRVWNIERTRRVPMVDYPIVTQEKVTKLRNRKGGKIIASALDWIPDGKSCVLGCSDGRLRIVDPISSALKPLGETSAVIAGGEEITSVTCAPDSCASPLVLVRSSDDSLRVFDRRMFSQPVKEFTGLPNAISETNACFVGKSGDHFMTGTSARRKGGTSKGSVRLFDRQRMEEVWKSEMEECAGSVVCTSWHSSINQCIVGTGDGKIHVMYHTDKSQRGMLSCLSKSEYRKTHGVVSLGYGEAVPASSLHSLRGNANMAHEGQNELLHSKRFRRELSNARKPKQYTGPSSLAQTSSVSMAKHVAAKDVSSEWCNDPREAILKYADVARKDPQFTTAYQKTQPEVILAEKTAEQEEEETRRAIYERDRNKKAKRSDGA